jgi:hypothetical protein
MSNIITSTNFQLEIIPGFHPFRVESPDPSRSIHEVARVKTAFRTFVLLQDFNNQQDVWLNEFTGSTIEVIEDDELFKALFAFLLDKGVLTVDADQDAQAEKQGGVR